MAPTASSAAQALLQALCRRPHATASQLAQDAGIGRSTATKLLASLAADGRVRRQPGGHQHGRRRPDRWTLTPTTPKASHDPAAPSTAAVPPGEEAEPSRSGAGRGRLAAGELRRQVLTYLADRPQQALSPTAIATALGRSAGAVANALRILASQGAVAQTQAAPRRYTITHDRTPTPANH